MAEESEENKSGKDDKGTEDISGLKSALEKEREARKKMEAEVAKLTKAAEKAAADKQASEDAKKDELQKAQEKLAELEKSMKRSSLDQMRLEIASEKVPAGTPLSKVRSLAQRLTGETKEELEKDADEFVSLVFPKKDEGEGSKNGDAGKGGKSDEDKGGKESYLGPRGTPKEDLVSGNTGKPAADADADDPDKIAQKVFESTRI